MITNYYEKKEQRINYYLFILCLYVFIFQNPLQSLPFGKYIGYFDEAFAAIGILIFILKSISSRKIKYRKTESKIVFFIGVFVFTGICGNFIYNYQDYTIALADLFLNLKYFLAIITSCTLFGHLNINKLSKQIMFHIKLITIMLCCLAMIDKIFNLFDSSVRYGVRATQLFYSHPTYLAAICVLLIAISIALMNTSRITLKYIAMQLVLLCFTLRIKAICAAVIFVLYYYWIVIRKKKFNMRLVLVIIPIVLWIALEKFQFYYVALADSSARSLLTTKSFIVANDHFPFGAGFATYASYFSGVSYSPLYIKYGLSTVYGLVNEDTISFMSDTFWPMILGQSGYIGTVFYILALFTLFKMIQRIKNNQHYYCSALCLFSYLIIVSSSESAFVHTLAIPMAMWMGILFNNSVYKVTSKNLI